jgi:hypothetical protein
MQSRIGLETATGLIAVNARQLNIYEDEVRPMRRRRGKPRLTVHGFDDFKIGAREQIPQNLPIVFVILDHQDALAHNCPTCASTRAGTVK